MLTFVCVYFIASSYIFAQTPKRQNNITFVYVLV